jgi:hypothetical protein
LAVAPSLSKYSPSLIRSLANQFSPSKIVAHARMLVKQNENASLIALGTNPLDISDIERGSSLSSTVQSQWLSSKK